MTNNSPVIKVDNLKKHFSQTESITSSVKRSLFGGEIEKVQAVDGVDFNLEQNQVQGVIGESGCGKSTLLKTLIGLHEPTEGEIYFKGDPVSEFSKSDWKDYRQNVQLIFQDPFNSLDPKLTVREVLMEQLKIHKLENREERMEEALSQAELSPPEKYLDRLPRQLSGGEKQRVSIARALVVDPDVILSDEPVSMLDVSTQASILNTLGNLIDELDLSMIYISHDLSTVSYICQMINVMYLGRIVEKAPTMEIINDPKHPYSRALIDAIPIPDPHNQRERTDMTGTPSDPSSLPSGCRFKDRCPDRMDICDTRPVDWDVSENREVACHLHYDHTELMSEKSAAAQDGETS